MYMYIILCDVIMGLSLFVETGKRANRWSAITIRMGKLLLHERKQLKPCVFLTVQCYYIVGGLLLMNT